MSDDLQRVPLHDRHLELGGRMVPFAGFSMPVKYTSIKEEHHAVRQGAGIFDVSHMGRFYVHGRAAVEAVNAVVTNDLARLTDGRALYTVMCNEAGGIIDDLVIYRLATDRLLICVNAANRTRDWEHLQHHLGDEVELVDRSTSTAQLALQGPSAQAVLQRLTDADLGALKFFRSLRAEVADVDMLVARTGYTGEDGFELYLPVEGAQTVYDAILASSAAEVVPCGLGCRDTLRLEAGLMLHGQDIDETTNPLEAGLSWLVKFEGKGNFVGRAALEAIRDEGPQRKMVGFVLQERGVLRPGYPVEIQGQTIGVLTSGSVAPTLEASIGLGYIDKASAEVDEVDVVVRSRTLRARVVKPPFYKRS